MNKLKQNCETKSENYQYENKLEFTVNVFHCINNLSIYLKHIWKGERMLCLQLHEEIAWQSSTIDSHNPNTKIHFSFFVCSTSK